MKARLLIHVVTSHDEHGELTEEKDFGTIEVPGESRDDLPVLIKHRHKYFVLDGVEDDSPDDEPLAHYAEMLGTFYDHDAARGVR